MLGRLIIGFIIFGFASCMYNADPVNWNRYPYVVKIISRDFKLKNATTCTGTLISPSAVLTNSKCFPFNRESMEAQAIITIAGSRSTLHKPMLDLRIDGEIAIMRIDSIRDKVFCEKPPHPSRISRLNMKPSLTEAVYKPVSPKDVQNLRCRLIGFETNDNVENFAKSSKTQLLDVELRTQDDNLMFSEVYGNSTGNACWDDLGAPLECAINEENIWIQVGFLNAVYSRGIQEESISNVTCSDIQTMQFVVFSDESVPRSIELVDKVGVFEAHDSCF